MDNTEVRSNFAWFLQIPTRWIDNDMYGHMNNARYYSIYENLIMTFLGPVNGLDTGTGPIRCFTAENGCRYFDALKYPDVIDAGLRVARIGNSSVRYEMGLFAEQKEEVASTAFVVDVFVDAATERPVSVPAEFRAVLERCMVESGAK